MSVLNQSGEEQVECPLCMEPLEVDDLNFYPCTCGYQVCTYYPQSPRIFFHISSVLLQHYSTDCFVLLHRFVGSVGIGSVRMKMGCALLAARLTLKILRILSLLAKKRYQG